MRDGQLENWKRYLRDNPLRYMMRRECPDLFQRALCLTIGGVRYSAFGNCSSCDSPRSTKCSSTAVPTASLRKTPTSGGLRASGFLRLPIVATCSSRLASRNARSASRTWLSSRDCD